VAAETALSQSVEEYLEAIHRLSRAPRGVSTTALAQVLGVTPASVTGMLRRMSEMGLISYRKYRDISLTARGRRRAREMIRRHRLAERLLTDVLGVPLEQAHDEACRLEHAFSPDLVTRIASTLGDPRDCPHGNPIDASADDPTLPLSETALNTPRVIARLEEESPEVLRYLAERSLLPGARVTVKLREPLGESVVVEVEGRTHTLGPRLAATVRVRKPRRRER